jgi:5-methyltetrahydrofolate--homocysteine methyltransferase
MNLNRPKDELNLHRIYEFIVAGHFDETRDSVARALRDGVDAQSLLNSYVIPAMEAVGELFESGEYFIPEMLVSARAAGEVLKLAEPYLLNSEHEAAGVVVMGTVKGDLHDLGKNIVSMMLKGSGFQVVDLGTDVGPAKFIQAARKHRPDLIGMSALLTTTMNSLQVAIKGLEEEGLRDGLPVMVGGAPVTKEYATSIGADGYAANAAAAVRLAGALVQHSKS